MITRSLGRCVIGRGKDATYWRRPLPSAHAVTNDHKSATGRRGRAGACRARPRSAAWRLARRGKVRARDVNGRTDWGGGGQLAGVVDDVGPAEPGRSSGRPPVSSESLTSGSNIMRAREEMNAARIRTLFHASYVLSYGSARRPRRWMSGSGTVASNVGLKEYNARSQWTLARLS